MKRTLPGYTCFQLACQIYEKLFPNEIQINGGSRRMRAICKTLNEAYQIGYRDGLFAYTTHPRRGVDRAAANGSG